MNQHTQTLAELAGGIRKRYPEAWQFTDAQLEQFYFMIVQKCIDLVGEFTCEQLVSGNTYTLVDAESVLKQHFGVEE